MAPETADRIAEGMGPIVTAYLEAKAEAARTGQPAVRPIPGGRLVFDPATDGDDLAAAS